MKKLILGMVVMCFASLVSAQSQRLVFMEEFTQASCPPCEQTTPALNEIVEANADKIVQIRYQTSWPGVDPMNADNPTEVQARVEYYGVDGVPAVFVDGSAQEGVGVLTQEAINSSYGNAAPISLTVEHGLSDDLSKMNVTVKIKNEGSEAFAPSSSDKLRVALIEEVVTWPFRPGSTSLTVFEAVMKKFFTGVEGVSLGDIAAGETWEMTWTDLDLPETVYDYRQLAVVAWVQNDGTKAVANAGMSHPVEVSGANLTVAGTGTTADDLCDYQFTPTATVTNNGTVTSGDYTVSVLVNGEAVQTVAGTPLEMGQSATIDVSAFDLAPGSSNVSLLVSTEATDLALLDNVAAAGSANKAGAPTTESISLDLEADGIGSIPNSTIVNRPFDRLNFIVVSQEALNANNPLGGFGESDKSLIVNFYQWNPANADPNGSMIIANQYTVADGAAFGFDYAYTPWQNSTDKLEIQVSTDCGSTFTTVWEKSGTELQTADQLNMDEQYFVPTKDDWRSESIDLSSYAGQDVMIRFAVTSAWGDMLWLDNFKIFNAVGTNELNENESFSFYPNPTNSLVNLELNIETVSNVSVDIMDALGRIVHSERIGENLSGAINHTLDLSALQTGMYMMNTKIGDRSVIETIQVVK